MPASGADAHRPLGPEHDLASALSRVQARQITSDYTFSYEGVRYRILPACIQPGLRGGTVRVERRLDGMLAVRFGPHRLAVEPLAAALPKAAAKNLPAPPSSSPRKVSVAERTKEWRESANDLFRNKISTRAAAAIDRTRTR